MARKVEHEPVKKDDREFFLALDQLSKERKLDKDLLIKSIEAGLSSAYKKEMGESRTVVAKLNEEAGRIEYYAYQKVVEGEPQEDNELSLEEAQDIDPNAKVGDIIGEDITPIKLSRIAAQTAKQVIMQRINEAIREQIANEMNDKEGELVSAVVRRIESGIVYVEITGSQMEGVLSVSDQCPTDDYHVGDIIKVFVKRVRENAYGNTQVVVSRSCAGFVKKLFEVEVPELKSGLVKVKILSAKRVTVRRWSFIPMTRTWTHFLLVSVSEENVSTASSDNLAAKRSTLFFIPLILPNILFVV